MSDENQLEEMTVDDTIVEETEEEEKEAQNDEMAAENDSNGDPPNEEASNEKSPENDETTEDEPAKPKPILYNLNISPPVRCVKIVARLINLDLDIRDLNVFNGEHLKEPFIKMNPEHTVPTLDDGNGLIIWDSHAITTYLIDKYGENDSLYPKDLGQRARCNQRLFFNNGILFPRFRAVSRHVFSGGDSIPDDFVESIRNTYNTLEAFLESNPFLVGDQMTVADICTSVTTTCLSTVAPIDEDDFPKISAWLNRIKEEIPFFDEDNAPFVQEYCEIISAKMETNKLKDPINYRN